jgi:hypothetical protein
MHGGGNGGGHVSSGNNMGNNNRPRSAASLRHQTFDSNCIDVRVRGNAWQVHEKYQALARDAQSAGDRVAAENFLQHAEHYFRIIEAINEATAAEQTQRGPSQPPVPFGQQPEVPSNYYGGAPPTQQPAGNPAGDANGNVTPLPGAQAEVQQRAVPPNTFFAPDEVEEQAGQPPLAARR